MQRTSHLRLSVLAALAVLTSVHAQQPAPVAPAAVPSRASALSQAKQPAPSLAALQGNVQTVESLIKTENELALLKARKERVQAGLEQDRPAMSIKTKGPIRMTVDVESIAGLDGRLRAYLTANGQRYENVGVGAKVQSCQIEAIQNRCVVFKPASASSKAEQCPTACWTGQRAQPLQAVFPDVPGAGNSPMRGGPLPMPMQAPPSPLPAGAPVPIMGVPTAAR